MTAHDAVMNGYRLVVLSGCCAAESDEDHNAVLDQLHRYFHAVIRRGDHPSARGSARYEPGAKE
jgi:nicotinamidase-related amidase